MALSRVDWCNAGDAAGWARATESVAGHFHREWPVRRPSQAVVVDRVVCPTALVQDRPVRDLMQRPWMPASPCLPPAVVNPLQTPWCSPSLVVPAAPEPAPPDALATSDQWQRYRPRTARQAPTRQPHTPSYVTPARALARPYRTARQGQPLRAGSGGDPWYQHQGASAGGLGGGRCGDRCEGRRPHQTPRLYVGTIGSGRIGALAGYPSRDSEPCCRGLGGGAFRDGACCGWIKGATSTGCLAHSCAGTSSGGSRAVQASYGKAAYHSPHGGAALSSSGAGSSPGSSRHRHTTHRQGAGAEDAPHLDRGAGLHRPGIVRCDPAWDLQLPCGLSPSQISDLLFREITPEDYELLLRLDETVARPTTSKAFVDSMPEARAEDSADKSCSVCLLTFNSDDAVAELPCKHLFHRSCIGKWLTERSRVCPLCSVEVFPS